MRSTFLHDPNPRRARPAFCQIWVSSPAILATYSLCTKWLFFSKIFYKTDKTPDFVEFLIMRRALVAHDHSVSSIRFAAGFALHQHVNPSRQSGDFIVLSGHHLRQFFDSAGKMGDLFFKFFHAASIGAVMMRVKRRGVGLALGPRPDNAWRPKDLPMTLTIETQNRVTTITLNRPQARNAVDPETARQLYDAFLVFDVDAGADVAILTGAGGYFCAGFDLKAAARGVGQEWLNLVDIPTGWNDAQTQPIPAPMGPSRLILSKPVIAAVEGHAVAGGLELAAWCDMRIASESAIFGVFCRRWGVPLIDGGTVRLPRIVGQGRANDLILTGRPVDAKEAQQMGLADRVVATGTALEAAQEIAQALSRFPQTCMRADHASARLSGAELAVAMRREWKSFQAFRSEGAAGAARFAGGLGRGGDFAEI